MLTERRIRDAKPGPKTRILWDAQVKGLGVRITPAGAKSFILNYYVGGRERRATLARVSEVTLKAARERAGRELAAIRDGESDPLERRRAAREAPTVNDALARFFGEHAPARMEAGRLTEKTVADYGKQARRYVGPQLGALQVAKVTRHDVEKFATGMAKTPAQRNRTLAFLSRVSPSPSIGSGDRSTRTQYAESSGRRNKLGIGFSRLRSLRHSPKLSTRRKRFTPSRSRRFTPQP